MTSRTFRDRVAEMTVNELVAGITHQRDDYLPEVVAVMEAEVEARKVAPDVIERARARALANQQREREKLVGTKGSIVFFQLWLLMSSLFNLVGGVQWLVAAKHSEQAVMPGIVGIALLFCAMFALWVGWAFATVRPRAVRYAYGYFLATTLLALFVELEYSQQGRIFGTLFRAFVGCLYLATSRRVRATFAARDKGSRS